MLNYEQKKHISYYFFSKKTSTGIFHLVPLIGYNKVQH